MDPFLVRGVELAVPNTGTGGHALKFTGTDNRTISQTVLVFERPVQDIGDNLHVPVAVHPKSLTGCNPVVVDNPQRTKPHVSGIVVICKREAVVGVEPAMVEVAPLGSFAYLNHCGLL